MANEIKVSFSLTVTNGNFKRSVQPGSISIDQSTALSNDGTQLVGTAVEQLEIGDVATAGYLYLRNLDATNFVTYGSSDGLEFKLKAGEIALQRITAGTTTITMKADTASVKVERLVLND